MTLQRVPNKILRGFEKLSSSFRISSRLNTSILPRPAKGSFSSTDGLGSGLCIGPQLPYSVSGLFRSVAWIVTLPRRRRRLLGSLYVPTGQFSVFQVLTGTQSANQALLHKGMSGLTLCLLSVSRQRGKLSQWRRKLAVTLPLINSEIRSVLLTQLPPQVTPENSKKWGYRLKTASFSCGGSKT
jgi:hypothetical protein